MGCWCAAPPLPKRTSACVAQIVRIGLDSATGTCVQGHTKSTIPHAASVIAETLAACPKLTYNMNRRTALTAVTCHWRSRRVCRDFIRMQRASMRLLPTLSHQDSIVRLGQLICRPSLTQVTAAADGDSNKFAEDISNSEGGPSAKSRHMPFTLASHSVAHRHRQLRVPLRLLLCCQVCTVASFGS